MATWGEFLASLRSELDDTGNKPRWSDAQLWAYTKYGIYDYSQWFPRRVDRAQLTDSGDYYTLPVDFVADISVESPQDRFLEKRPDVPGKWFRDVGSKPTYYYISGGNLYLNGSPDDAVLLTYMATHLVPTSSTATTFALSIPDRDLELLSLYVKAAAHADMRAKTARLDRYDPSSGRRDDNPLLPETDALMSDYHRLVGERLGGRVIHLYRRGGQ